MSFFAESPSTEDADCEFDFGYDEHMEKIAQQLLENDYQNRSFEVEDDRGDLSYHTIPEGVPGEHLFSKEAVKLPTDGVFDAGSNSQSFALPPSPYSEKKMKLFGKCYTIMADKFNYIVRTGRLKSMFDDAEKFLQDPRLFTHHFIFQFKWEDPYYFIATSDYGISFEPPRPTPCFFGNSSIPLLLIDPLHHMKVAMCAMHEANKGMYLTFCVTTKLSFETDAFYHKVEFSFNHTSCYVDSFLRHVEREDARNEAREEYYRQHDAAMDQIVK